MELVAFLSGAVKVYQSGRHRAHRRHTHIRKGVLMRFGYFLLAERVIPASLRFLSQHLN